MGLGAGILVPSPPNPSPLPPASVLIMWISSASLGILCLPELGLMFGPSGTNASEQTPAFQPLFSCCYARPQNATMLRGLRTDECLWLISLIIRLIKTFRFCLPATFPGFKKKKRTFRRRWKDEMKDHKWMNSRVFCTKPEQMYRQPKTLKAKANFITFKWSKKMLVWYNTRKVLRGHRLHQAVISQQGCVK